jgi:hypothetical protein
VHFLAAIAVLAAMIGAGALVLSGLRLRIDDRLREAATVVSIGFVSLSLLALLLGSVHLFHPGLLAAVTAVFAIPGAYVCLRVAPRLRAAWRDAGWERWLGVATAAIVAFDALLASAPPTSGDAIAYHLVAPKLWLHAGRMFPIWWDWNTFQPFATEMHFAYAEAISDGRAAMVVGALLGGFSAVCVYGLGRELAGPKVGALAALLWVGQGMFLWEATGGFVELVAGGLVALAAWHLAAFLRDGRVLDASLAGVALGAAAATKIHVLVLAPLFLLVAVLGRKERRLRAAGALVAAAVLVAAPWYLRSLLLTGNPIYPILFGGKYWNAADKANFKELWKPYGVHGFWRFPFFPLEFLLAHGRYERGYSFGPAIFLLAPLGAVVGGRWARILACGSLVYLIVWWVAMYQITRYLIPVLPFLSVLAAFGGVWLGRRSHVAVASVAVVGAAALIAITGVFARQILPGALGTESPAHFVQRLTGTYDAFRYLDTRLPGQGRVMTIGIRNLYWLDRLYMRATPALIAPGDPPSEARRWMRHYDVRYIASLGGVLAPWLARESRLTTEFDVPLIGSRALGKVEGHTKLRVYLWCAARPSPCR